MACDAIDDLIEELAEAMPSSASSAASAASVAHLDVCGRCRARLARARAIHTALAARPEPEPPARFTLDVMARIRRERWRAEQWLDTGFNVAVVAGVVFIAAGVAGVLWASGIAAIGGDLVSLAASGTGVLVDRLARDAQAVAFTIAFLAATAGVWWWTESDAVL